MTATTPPAHTTRPCVLITGASSGIGRAFAAEAVKDGLPLLLVARSGDDLEALAAEVRGKGGEAHSLALDITAADAVDRIVAYLARNDLHVESLVNNAGYGLLGQAAELAPGAQLGIIQLNCTALTALTLAFLPGMVARGKGGVLNVGSVAGFLPGPGMAVYYASKAFVRSFSEALWEESRRAGVTVSCLAPGPVETPFIAKAGAGRSALFQSSRYLSAERCAAIGWAGFKARERIILPDATSRIVSLLGAFVPRRIVLHHVRKLQKARKQ